MKTLLTFAEFINEAVNNQEPLWSPFVSHATSRETDNIVYRSDFYIDGDVSSTGSSAYYLFSKTKKQVLTAPKGTSNRQSGEDWYFIEDLKLTIRSKQTQGGSRRIYGFWITPTIRDASAAYESISVRDMKSTGISIAEAQKILAPLEVK